MKKMTFKKHDKNEKRRLLLDKRHPNKEEYTNNNTLFDHPAGSSLFVKENGGEAVRTPLNKRLIAIILAIVMVVGLIPAGIIAFRTKAAPEQTLKMDPVTMQVRINGVYTTDASVPAGVIADNIDTVTASLDNPTNAEFVQAVIRDANGVETPIYAVGDKNHVIYYSVRNGGYTGVEKAATDTLILDYGNRYNITFANATENDGVFTVTGNTGTFRTNAKHDSDGYYIYGNEDLKFTAMNPAQDYVASTVGYISPTASGTERVRNSAATISKNNMTGDMNITVNFSEVQSYSVRDARDISNSKYYPNLSGVDNHGGTTNSLSSDTGSLDTVRPQTASTSFYVFSQANSGSENWRLDMLSINGKDIVFPQEVGATTAPQNVNGMSVTVTLETEQGKFTGESKKPRTFYRIDMSNVHQDVEVAYYFVNTKAYTIMVKGLEGIEATGASIEDEYLLNRYYTFDTNKYNVYKANYTAPGFLTGNNYYPSDNLILYRVKPGYNPYTVSTEMSYDFGQNKTSSGIREKSAGNEDSEAGTPLEVIAAAGNGGLESSGRYNTSFRHWGRNNVLENRESTYRKGFRTYDLLLTTIEKDSSNTWYAVALAQNENKTQQLYLNAQPYRYRLEVDVNDNNASLSDSDYSLNASSGYYLENSANGHTVADAQAYAFLPANEPTRSGKYFKGWQMVDADGNAVSETLYQASQRINFDEDTIRYALGTENRQNLDLTLCFKAIWGDLKDADATTVLVNSYYQTAVSDDDSEKYTHVVSDAEESQVKGKTALLYDQTGKYDDPYYVINSDKSDLYKTTKALNDDGTYDEDTNAFVVFYDYRLQDLSVKKSVLGYPKTKMYSITVKLTRDHNSPVSFTDGQALIRVALDESENTISASEVDTENEVLTYELNLTKDQIVNFANVPYGWSYEVTEPEVKNDYSNEIKNGSGRLTKDIDVDVTNMVDTAELYTNKFISGPDANGKYKLTLESWATGEKITKYDKKPIPTDIVLVVDQSGSMATTDMSGEFVPVKESNAEDAQNKTNWTIGEAAGDTVYYAWDETDQKHYPVQAGEGTVYVEAEPVKPENIYTGLLPNGASISIGSSGGSPILFNIDTPYFYPLLDSNPDNKVPNSKMQPVKETLVSGLTLTRLNIRRHAYLYFYTDDTLYSTSGKNGDGSQWSETIQWTNISSSESGEKWKSRYMYEEHNLLNHAPSAYWPNYKDRIAFIRSDGQKLDGTYQSADIAMNSFTTARLSWFGNTYDFVISAGDYVDGLYKQTTGHDYLYYVRDDGTKVNITSDSGCQVYREDLDTAYNNVLYEKRGKSRTYALQESVRTFTELVAQNAADNNINNRLAIVGFAGNEMPAPSSGTEPIGKNGIWDYTNTGMFVNGTFKNYKEIKDIPDGYRKLTSSEAKYINRHYYIYDYERGENNTQVGTEKEYIPVVCASNGRWYRLDSYYYVSTANGTYSFDFYEPVYDPLNENEGNNYDNAFLNVKDNDGSDDNTYNDTIDAEIDQFSAYGGTYTSYGMAMANQIFANNPIPSGEERNRIIIVFTDGVPGGSGYEEDIAKEAIADAAVAKTQYGAEVYTIGLYPGYQEQVVTNFMNELSNNAAGTATTDVCGTTKNAIVGDLKAENEYFYTDPDEGKTYSVTAKDRDGNSTLGWWSTTSVTGNNETFNVYSSYEPMTSSSDEVDGHVQFYTDASCRNRIYVSSNNWSESATYYVSGGIPVKHEYRWYNSNGRVKDPKTSASDTATNHVQFFTVTSDAYNEDLGYYQVASDWAGLTQKFKDISDNMSKTTVKLDGENSVLRDVVTGKFANVNKNDDVKVYTVKGTYDGTDSDNPYHWSISPEDKEDITNPDNIEVKKSGEDDRESIVDVKGFNYSTNYLSATHPNGKKLVVEISNLDPQEVGFNLESNTDQSAVYQTEKVDGQTEETLLAPFTIPYIHRPEYKLHIDGDDHNAKYTVKLKLTKDGENGQVALTDDQVVKYLTDGALDTLEINDNGEITVWENKTLGSEDTYDDTLVLENVFKDLLKGYHVYAQVSKTDDEEGTYTYSVKKNNQDTQVFDSFFELTKSGDEIDITSKRQPQDVVIKELTLASDATNDFTDKGKVFEIEVQLYDENHQKVTGDFTCGGTTYSDGKLTLSLRHEQSRTIQVPIGYTIQVGEVDSFEYDDSYKKTIDSTEADISKNVDVLVEKDKATMVTVINTLDTTPQTGLFDNLKVNPFFFAAIGLAIIGAGWLAIVEKRKRQMSEE